MTEPSKRAKEIVAMALGDSVPKPYVQLVITDPTTLEGVPVPHRQWIVEDWLPAGVVTLSYGDGGVGKTLLAQQLATACATGRAWIGLPVKQCRVFSIYCEDDAGEVHRRQERINQAMGITYADLGDMRYACAVGADNVLLRFERDGSWMETPRFLELTKAAMDHGAELLVIDTAADTFGGNENDRAQVRAYLGALLARLARDTGAAVLVNAHPSRSGLSTAGDMDGGSTAWSNTARSRWALARPAAEEGAASDETLRILSRRKANYSSIGDTVELRWTDGVLIPARQQAPTGFEAVNRALGAERTFLALLASTDSQKRHVSASKTAGNFAPKLFATLPDRNGYTRKDFERAMNSLFTSNRITNLQYGRKSDERHRIAVAIELETETDTPSDDWFEECADAGFPQAQQPPEEAGNAPEIAT